VTRAALEPAALGLSVRTGFAVVVILRGNSHSPQIALRHGLQLSDPWLPESGHPFHQELGERASGGAEARVRGCKAARRATRRAIRALIEETRAHGLEPAAAALVTRDLRAPERVRGAHPRAHAEEARLCREAVAAAFAECGVVTALWLERDLRARAAKVFRRTRAELDGTLRRFARSVGTPWRADEKRAALAAWLSLPLR
jgi:hypothetical protein